MLILNMPIIATLLTLVAGPTSAYGEAVRYVLPLVYTIPLFLCISLFVMRDNVRIPAHFRFCSSLRC